MNVKKVFLWSFGLLFTLGILGCAAVAGLFYWASRDLPDLERLTGYEAPQATVILARDGSTIGTLATEKRYSITLKEMSPWLPMSFLAAEDDSFYQHHGVDPVAIVRAFIYNLRNKASGGGQQGGSTITQQIIKQLLLSSERSYTRKMKEAILAYRLEHTVSKDDILQTYLNYIYLGQHSYGVEAAARTYFGKHASDITLAESAVIAGLPQAPSRYNPFRHPEAAKARQMYVLGRLRTLKWITEEQYQQAINEPLVYWSMPENRGGASKWYFEEARRLLVEFFTEENLRTLGIDTLKSGEEYVYTAGLTVRTAMDPVQQDAAGAALRRGLEELDKRQGWRGPVKKLSPAEVTEFREKSTFAPADLMGKAWVQAVVTAVDAKGARVLLGKGYTGYIPVANMSWARTPNRKISGWGAPAVRDARKVLNVNDLIMVSAAPVTVQAEGGKKGKAATKTVDFDPATASPQKPITLLLQQEPLVQGALASVETQSGDVVALIGGYQFGDSHFNRATQARRQPGSSFKPVVYSTALDFGFTPTSSVLDGPFVYVNPYTNEVWRPGNYEKNFRGIMPLYEALTLSRNTCTVRLAHKVGISNVIQRAKMLGLEPHFPQELSISLGAVAVSPLRPTPPSPTRAWACARASSPPSPTTTAASSTGRTSSTGRPSPRKTPTRWPPCSRTWSTPAPAAVPVWTATSSPARPAPATTRTMPGSWASRPLWSRASMWASTSSSPWASRNRAGVPRPPSSAITAARSKTCTTTSPRTSPCRPASPCRTVWPSRACPAPASRPSTTPARTRPRAAVPRRLPTPPVAVKTSCGRCSSS